MLAIVVSMAFLDELLLLKILLYRKNTVIFVYIFINFKPILNASMTVESDGTTLSIVMTLPCDNGQTVTAIFSGSIQ